MTSRGTYNGLGAGTWTRFRPKMICPGGTDPTFADNDLRSTATGPLGKYLVLPNGDISVQYQLAWFNDSTFGSGAYYAWRLPFPARRFAPAGTDSFVPLGVGQAYRNALANNAIPSPQCDIIPILAPASDPNMTARDDPDWYFVALVPHCLDYSGSITPAVSTITSTNNTATVSHDIGFAFDPADIQIQINAGNVAASGTGNGLNHISVSSISSTQFTFTAHTAQAGAIPISWKVRTDAMPSGAYSAFASPTQPYNWANLINELNVFGDFFFSLKYTPRR